MTKTKYFLLALSAVLCLSMQARGTRTGVALVVDEVTANAVKPQLDAFAAQLVTEGKDVHVLSVPLTADPQSIRDTLRFLHANRRLEGAVLIGDIPVPMIRRAHHLATAFKMNPAIKRERSSIPSDRFYDDFALEFDAIDHDGPLWYYDLSPRGAQRVECDIYTARIKPAKTDPGHSFTELIAASLERFTDEHRGERKKIDRVFHFAGHGNSSESFNARIDENRAYYEMFGFNDNSERVDFINFDEDRFVRERLQKILSRKDIDIVHLHTHGAVKAQYISKEPYTFMPTQYAENVKRFLRDKMRSAKDKEKAKDEWLSAYDVPESWIAGWDDPEQSRKDSLRSAAVDITLRDLDGFKSGPALIMLDACFNGAFQHDDYVAARYAFSQGSGTIAVMANSVNIIQDHWKNELIGLLAHGVSIGNWIKNIQTLESHVFGDPTYVFACKGKSYDADVAFPSPKTAKKMLSQSDPSVCGFAIKYLIRKGELSPSRVLAYLRDDPRMNVRMEVLMSIVRNPGDYDVLVSALVSGITDSYELVRRMSARYAAICCDPAIVEASKKALEDPLVTSRVKSHLSGGIYGASNKKEAAEIADKSLSVKERGFAVSAQRNKCNPAAAAPMLELLADPDSPKALKLKAAEALGWYVLSVRRDDIYKGCWELAGKETDAEVKDELIRTIARLKDNAYCR